MQRKFLYKLVLLLLSCLASGCGSLMNLTYDQHEYFKELRNSEVGKSIKELVGDIPESWQPDIVKIVKIDVRTIEYRFTYGQCSWATVVNTSTDLVQSWRFISAPEECKSLKYYEGPW